MKSKKSSTIEIPNLKEANAAHIFKVTIRDRDHFYKIVNWLNTHVGRGSNLWTMEGKPLRALKQGKSVEPKIYVFKQDTEFNAESAFFLTLL